MIDVPRSMRTARKLFTEGHRIEARAVTAVLIEIAPRILCQTCMGFGQWVEPESGRMPAMVLQCVACSGLGVACPNCGGNGWRSPGFNPGAPDADIVRCSCWSTNEDGEWFRDPLKAARAVIEEVARCERVQ